MFFLVPPLPLSAPRRDLQMFSREPGAFFQRVLLSFSLSLRLPGCKITVCCGVGGPMIVTTRRSVSANAVPAARKSPYLWEFSRFFFSLLFLLSLHLLLPAPTCLQGLVCVDASSGLNQTYGRCCGFAWLRPSYHVRMLTHKVNFRHAQLTSQGALGGFKSYCVTLSSLQSGTTCRSLRCAA